MAFKLSSFLAELKRRKVYRVATVYVVVGAGIIGVCDGVVPDQVWGQIQIPVGIVLLVGLPIALIMAWAFELKPEKSRPIEPPREEPLSGPATRGSLRTADPEGRRSIVVLPFDNMSPDPADAYFCDGLTEEIITSLSHIRSLRVISRNSAMVLKGTQKDTRTIGQELGVQYVLEGSVRKAGNDLRITAQLIDAPTDSHLWAEKYDGVLDDVFGMQETLSRAIVDALKLTLSTPEDQELSLRPIKDFQAYELYLLGRHHWHRFTEKDISEAINYFRQAVDRDPTFGLAYGGLAAAHLTLSGPGVPGLPARVGVPKAKSAAAQALRLDQDSVLGGVTMAFIHAWFELDQENAERAFERVVSANPGISEAHEAYAMYLSMVGSHDEAFWHISTAIELDPLWPIYFANAAEILYMARRFDESLEYCRRALELDSGFAWGRVQTAMTYLQLGDYEQAIEQLEKHVDPRFPWGAQFLGYAYGKTGRSEDSLRIIEQLTALRTEGFASAANVAMVHLGRGEEDLALDNLEAALHEHPPGSTALAYVGVEPAWDPLRAQKRFQQVEARIRAGPARD